MSDEELARLHSPLGLDLGAETPEETALSILAEIIAARRAGSGAPLRDLATPIHGAPPAVAPAHRRASCSPRLDRREHMTPPHLDIDGLEPDDVPHLEHAIRLAYVARDRGDHPFGAILVTPDGTIVEGLNSVETDRDPTGHAETNLVRAASAALPSDVVAASTLYTSTEPCAMCASAIYWAVIPRVVYALGEDELIRIVRVHDSAPTLDLPSRDVFAHGGRAVEVIGPVPLPGAAAVHEEFWTGEHP